VRTVDAGRRAALQEALGDALDLTGQLDAAEDAYAHAYRLAPATLRLHLKRAKVRERRGQYSGAVRLIGRALRQDDGPGPARDAVLRAELLNLLAGVRFRQGDLLESAGVARRAIEAAEASGRVALLAHAYYLLGHAEALRGNSEGRDYVLKALALIDDAGDPGRKAHILNNLGVQSYFAGDLEGAIHYYEQCRQACDEAGDVITAATAQNNIGEALSDLGRLAEAEPLFREARATWRASRYRVGVGLANLNLGRLATRRGRFDEADTLLHDAATEFGEIGADDFVVETRSRIAENLLQWGNAEAALREAALAEGGLDDEQTAGVAALFVVKGRALAALGRTAEATAALAAAVATATSAGAATELAAATAALESVTGSQ
jgi:tetratricopeptide (TPR) repeat protein